MDISVWPDAQVVWSVSSWGLRGVSLAVTASGHLSTKMTHTAYVFSIFSTCRHRIPVQIHPHSSNAIHVMDVA